MPEKLLKDLECRNSKPKDKAYRLRDGGGLFLLVRPDGNKYWQFRYEFAGKEGLYQIGPLANWTLGEAREELFKLRRMVRDGLDPNAEKKRRKAELAAEKVRLVTFAECCEIYISGKADSRWKNAKHAQQWRNTLAAYAFPLIGNLAPADVDTGLLLRILEPIWKSKNETASRLRSRIELVLDWAKVRGYRSGENPARWRGHLQHLLTAPSIVQRATARHHAALPYSEMGGFMSELRAQKGVAALALEFTILTAARTGEVIGAEWAEIDFERGIWTIPSTRMKAGKEHIVPLSDAALTVLDKARASCEGDHVFSVRRGRPLSNMAMAALLKRMGRADVTVHGFRSSFRDWIAELTAYPSEVAEMALAHKIPNAVEAAYRRGTLVEKRRRMMAEWSEFCGRVIDAEGIVTPIRKSAA